MQSINRKQYGMVQYQGKSIIRNYRRELKNGKGLTYFEAVYSKDLPDYVELFESETA